MSWDYDGVPPTDYGGAPLIVMAEQDTAVVARMEARLQVSDAAELQRYQASNSAIDIGESGLNRLMEDARGEAKVSVWFAAAVWRNIGGVYVL